MRSLACLASRDERDSSSTPLASFDGDGRSTQMLAVEQAPALVAIARARVLRLHEVVYGAHGN